MIYPYNWTLEKDTLLKTLYSQGIALKKMPIYFDGLSATSITTHARSLGIRAKIGRRCLYNFDHQYFDVPTPENCYWAGIMQTDGHINKRKNQCYIRWGCAIKDRHHMELFKSMTRSEQPIKDILKKCQISTKDPDKSHRYAYINFESAKPWTDALEKHFGITMNKTLRSRMPELPTNLLKLSFMRGMMDGDGYVTVTSDQRKAASLGICGANREIILWFKQVVDSLHLSTLSRRPQNIMQPKNESCYYWKISGLSASILFELFRRLPTPGLARKWEDPRLLEISAYWKSRVDIWPSDLFFDNILKS